MAVKITLSYTKEEEAAAILELLKPVIHGFKVKKSTGKPPYGHVYLIPKKGGNRSR